MINWVVRPMHCYAVNVFISCYRWQKLAVFLCSLHSLTLQAHCLCLCGFILHIRICVHSVTIGYFLLCVIPFSYIHSFLTETSDSCCLYVK